VVRPIGWRSAQVRGGLPGRGPDGERRGLPGEPTRCHRAEAWGNGNGMVVGQVGAHRGYYLTAEVGLFAEASCV